MELRARWGLRTEGIECSSSPVGVLTTSRRTCKTETEPTAVGACLTFLLQLSGAGAVLDRRSCLLRSERRRVRHGRPYPPRTVARRKGNL